MHPDITDRMPTRTDTDSMREQDHHKDRIHNKQHRNNNNLQEHNNRERMQTDKHNQLNIYNWTDTADKETGKVAEPECKLFNL